MSHNYQHLANNHANRFYKVNPRTLLLYFYHESNLRNQTVLFCDRVDTLKNEYGG